MPGCRGQVQDIFLGFSLPLTKQCSGWYAEGASAGGQDVASIDEREHEHDPNTNRAGGLAGRWVRPLVVLARGQSRPQVCTLEG